MPLALGAVQPLGRPSRLRYLPLVCGPVRLSSDVSEIRLVFSIPPHRPSPNFPPSWNADNSPAGVLVATPTLVSVRRGPFSSDKCRTLNRTRACSTLGYARVSHAAHRGARSRSQQRLVDLAVEAFSSSLRGEVPSRRANCPLSTLLPPKSGSHWTPRWREKDSNSRSPANGSPFIA